MDNDAQALLQELSETRASLEVERARRIAAEAIAEERRLQLERSQAMVDSMQAQLSERFRSLDQLATKILDQHTPERPPTQVFKMERLPVKAAARREPTPGEFYSALQKHYGGVKPDAQKYPAVAAAIEKMAEETLQ